MTKKIFRSIMLVSAAAMVLGFAFVMAVLYGSFEKQLNKELGKEVTYLAKGVEKEGVQYLQDLDFKDSRVTYIDQDGTVLFDSKADAQEMENHSDREEFQKALRYGSGHSVRISDTLDAKTIYRAMRLSDYTVLRISGTQSTIFALLGKLLLPICGIFVCVVILSAFAASKVSQRIMDPVNSIDLDRPEEVQTYDEVAPLLSRIYQQNRQIAKQLELAKQYQEEFTIITENMREGLIVIDRYTMILSSNSSAWKLFKVSGDPIGESIYALNRREDFRRVIENVLEGNHEEIILKLDGNDIQLIANPVVREGSTEGAVLLLVNVTEKLERENLRREFSANVSHELKTPLTSISGFAEIIQDGFVPVEDARKFAGRIYQEAQHLIQLVEDVIRISQLDEAQVPYDWETVDVHRMVKEVCANLAETAKKLNVHMYVGGGRTLLYTVRPILEEAIYNLCDNAVKYNRDDGSVSILLRETPDHVYITVKDTGIGIPREDQSRVFERFYRVDKSHCKAVGGTGLGLSIVKHAVTFLKGSITLRSEEGAGTEITLMFSKEKN